MVKIYSIPDCPWCQKAKAYLQAKKVDFTVYNIEEDVKARQECQALSGDLTVPVITADGKSYVLGFDKPKLDEMLGL